MCLADQMGGLLPWMAATHGGARGWALWLPAFKGLQVSKQEWKVNVAAERKEGTENIFWGGLKC